MHALAPASEEQFVGRLRAAAYGLILIGLGVLTLVPGDQLNVWLAWTGLVLGAASAAKVAAGYAVPWFTVTLAVSAFVWGASDAAGAPISGIGLLATLGGIVVLAAAARTPGAREEVSASRSS